MLGRRSRGSAPRSSRPRRARPTSTPRGAAPAVRRPSGGRARARAQGGRGCRPGSGAAPSRFCAFAAAAPRAPGARREDRPRRRRARVPRAAAGVAPARGPLAAPSCASRRSSGSASARWASWPRCRAGAVADRFGAPGLRARELALRPRHAAAPARRPASGSPSGSSCPRRSRASSSSATLELLIDRLLARPRAARARASQAAARRALRRAGHVAARGHAAPGDRRRASACGWRWRRGWPSCPRRSSSSVSDRRRVRPAGRRPALVPAAPTSGSAAGASREALRQTRAAAGARVGAARARGRPGLARPRAPRVPDPVPGMSMAAPLPTATGDGRRPSADGVPAQVGRADVESVREEWLVEDRWWTARPLRRRYFELTTADGAEPGRVLRSRERALVHARQGRERDVRRAARALRLLVPRRRLLARRSWRPPRPCTATAPSRSPTTTASGARWSSRTPARGSGVKAITGAEVTLDDGLAPDPARRQTAPATRNLCRLLTAAHEGHAREPARAHAAARSRSSRSSATRRASSACPAARATARSRARRARRSRPSGRPSARRVRARALPRRAAAPVLAPRPRAQPRARAARRAARRAVRGDRQRALPPSRPRPAAGRVRRGAPALDARPDRARAARQRERR